MSKQHADLPVPCEACVRAFLESLATVENAAQCLHCEHEAGGVFVHARIEAGLIVTWALMAPVSVELASVLVGQLGHALEKAGLLPPKPADLN
jgi:hypothetical protein